MKSLTVLIDMDDTIEGLLDAWVNYLNNLYGTHIHPSEVGQWDISKSFPMLDKEQVYAPLYSDDLWRCVKPINGAADAIQRLMADGHKVLIVTTSAYETLKVKMDEVLFKYFPFLKWQDVIITSHKQLVKGDVLVDDGVHNLEGGNFLKILIDSPHNRSYNAYENGMTRVGNWGEAYTLITQYAETNL